MGAVYIGLLERKKPSKFSLQFASSRRPQPRHHPALALARPLSIPASTLPRFLSQKRDVTKAIVRDPEIKHGVPVLRGTRVPVQTLFEYLEGGDTLEDFLDGFPTVSRGLALEALEEAKHLLLASV